MSGTSSANMSVAFASSATASSSRMRPANVPLIMAAMCLANERDQDINRSFRAPYLKSCKAATPTRSV